MDQAICDAIATRRLLMFGYGDSVRLVEPHVYGCNTAGHEALSAWLRPGYSRADPEGGWRMFLLGNMHNIGVVAEPFTPEPDYNPRDPHFASVFCRVQSETRDNLVPFPVSDERGAGAASESSAAGSRASGTDSSVTGSAPAGARLDHSVPPIGDS